MYERIFLSELQVRFVIAQLASKICCRCELRYSDHGGGEADHLFFDNPEDVSVAESN
jgi:hypothetical protein